jgi:hypothetical protein
MEVSDEPTPRESVLPLIIDRSIKGSLAFIQGLRDHLLGRLDTEDSVPSPFAQSHSRFPGLKSKDPERAAHH